ncbi:MAG: hypothetical protein ACYCW5_02590 [Thermoleophilia bacterium]
MVISTPRTIRAMLEASQRLRRPPRDVANAHLEEYGIPQRGDDDDHGSDRHNDQQAGKHAIDWYPEKLIHFLRGLQLAAG